jgi:hypothetical protein
MDNAELYYKDTPWGRLRPDGAPITASTFKEHQWTIVVDGKRVKHFRIAARPEKQVFEI